MLTLLAEPNVLILDEPTNDVDTDMLAAMEDLLDSWPGTLIVVSHDRYLLERVTDQQYAMLDGRLRHLPGGVDEYLRLADQRMGEATAGSSRPARPPQRHIGADVRRAAPHRGKRGGRRRSPARTLGGPDRGQAHTNSPRTTSPTTSASPGSPRSCARSKTRWPRRRAAGWSCRSCSNEPGAVSTG